MYLTRLKAQHFRNFKEVNFEPCSEFNLIYGQNGSGKTSILEAIHFVSLGRSFRTHLINRIIQQNAQAFTVFGSVLAANNPQLNIGIEKNKNGKLRLKIGDEFARSASQLIKILPLQLLNPDSYNLLTEGPRLRREFLDWGVFHVEPQFLVTWQRVQQSLSQRNAALQNNASLNQIQAWNSELLPASIELTLLRENYFNQLKPIIMAMLERFIHFDAISMEFFAGWPRGDDLAVVLENAYARDRVLGYTQYGPQRADISFKIGGIPVQDILSRGEQKLLVCALKLAQGLMLRDTTGKKCVYLLDDLAAELDSQHLAKVIHTLATLEAQVFITSIESAAKKLLLANYGLKMFHVEHDSLSLV